MTSTVTLFSCPSSAMFLGRKATTPRQYRNATSRIRQKRDLVSTTEICPEGNGYGIYLAVRLMIETIAMVFGILLGVDSVVRAVERRLTSAASTSVQVGLVCCLWARPITSLELFSRLGHNRRVATVTPLDFFRESRLTSYNF